MSEKNPQDVTIRFRRATAKRMAALKATLRRHAEQLRALKKAVSKRR